MAIRNATTLKTFFETGDYPTQAQFADTIDSTSNNLITGDVTVDLNNVATVNPSIISGFKIQHIQTTRTTVQGSGTVTVSTTFAPKLIHITLVLSGVPTFSAGSIGRSDGTHNSCYRNIFSATFEPFASNLICAAYDNGSGGTWSVVINNFTSNSFDIVYTMGGGGPGTAILEMDVTG